MSYWRTRTTTLTAAIAAVVTTTLATAPAFAGYLHNDDYVVTTKVVPVQLVRGDQVEYGRLVYRAWVHKREQETGDTSKPLEGRFIDDRQCNWQISGQMQRQYFVTSITGQEDSQPAAAVDIPVHVAGNSNGLASFLDHDPCGDYRGQIQAGVQSAINELTAQFDQRMAADLEAFQTEMSGITVVINP